ncbi:Outer membrane protein [Salinivirga cyanobacteriivorans]|uniref:Outer membrane protein n=1 Tax=Salinivirga cyanobacteriivorans TaxID=1307839 RepID=A0A0S2HVU1_9BACT|nr:OmpH family outer membrane protein [Salinivirga cyanobacteriivorans]ALO14174.1 Outer membrane protein [Salinivirga cyanobacteriivorans]
MNKKNLVIELILAAVLIWVIVGNYSTDKNVEQDKEDIKAQDTQQTGLKVAYINTDSLLMNYKLAKELNKQFTSQQKQSQRELEQRMQKFQKNYQAFQEKVQRGGFLTQSSAEAQQQELLAEQQQLEKLNQQLSNNLMAREQSINQELYDSVSNFVKHYNKSKKYDLILNNTLGGSLIYGKQKYNITNEILQELNARYDRRLQQ